MAEAFAARIARELAHAPADASGVLIIRLGAVRRNYRKLCGAAPAAETAAAVKANAYGLGAAQVFQALEGEGCRTAFVAALAEAQALRGVSGQAAIYVLDGLFPGTPPLFEDIQARPVLSSFEELAEWSGFCKARGIRLPAALHIDTGMTRLGLPAQDVRRIAEAPDVLKTIDLRLIMSHLACGDDQAHAKNEAQRSQFMDVARMFPGVPRSLANSGGIFLGPPFHFDLTRPGIALYGGSPAARTPNPMEPAVWLYGRIAQVRWAGAGDTVGYGATQTLTRKTKIVTVSAGYADGYFRAVSASDVRDGPPGFARSHRLPLLGRVSMDLITFDATGVPDELVQRGGWIELMGERVTADDFAAYAGTISYEVLTSLGRRYHRIYVDE